MLTRNSLRYEVNLENLHTFKTVQKASALFTIQETAQLPELAKWVANENMPYLFLGLGANLVFCRDFQGLIIKNEIGGLEIISEDEHGVNLRVGSGILLDELICNCLEKKWFGIENLSGIPSTIGAAALQNVGAYGREMRDVVTRIYAFDFPNQRYCNFYPEQLDWRYRSSILHRQRKGEIFIHAVELYLEKQFSPLLRYKALQNLSPNLDAQSLRQYILKIRASKLPAISEIGNAGSFFKNPIVSEQELQKLLKLYPDLPIFNKDRQQSAKISAAYLIEKIGWKGRNIGRVGVYPKHALVLVNHGKANGSEVLALAKQIQKDCYEKTEIKLEAEVQLINQQD